MNASTMEKYIPALHLGTQPLGPLSLWGFWRATPRCSAGRPFDKPGEIAKLSSLKSTPPVPSPSKKPMPVTAVRKGFSDARRKALLTQGTVTIQRVRENQSTMKSVP